MGNLPAKALNQRHEWMLFDTHINKFLRIRNENVDVKQDKVLVAKQKKKTLRPDWSSYIHVYNTLTLIDVDPMNPLARSIFGARNMDRRVCQRTSLSLSP